MPIASQCRRLRPAVAPGARNATSTSSGTMARSSSSRIDTTPLPRAASRCRRAPRGSARRWRWRTARSPWRRGTPPPAGNPASDTDAGQQRAAGRRPAATPMPKISRRRLHSRDGCISSPMTNRNITTPSSATCRIACGSVNSRSPNGPIDEPGGQVAEHRAEAGALEQRNGDHRRAQKRDDMHQIGSLLRRRHRRPARSSDPHRLVYPKSPCTASLPDARFALTRRAHMLSNPRILRGRPSESAAKTRKTAGSDDTAEIFPRRG